MYALTQNKLIKVGPRNYYWQAFRNFLAQQGISTDNLPTDYSGSEPIIIDRDTRIVQVITEAAPNYNQYTEELAGPTYTITDTLITGIYGISDRELNAAKCSMKETLASNRYAQEVAGITLTLQSTVVSISTKRGFDRDIWFQMDNLLPAGSTQVYKFNNDLWLTLTKSDIQTVVTAIITHVQGAFDWEEAVSKQIDAASTKSEIENIDINWPIVGDQ
jgi:hypothetical protein